MSDIQVTRRDREMAERAELGMSDDEFAHGQESLDDVTRACRELWLGTGRVDFSSITELRLTDDMRDQLARVERIARGYAQARAEGFAAGKAAAQTRVTRAMVDAAIAAQDAAFNRFGTLCGATTEDGRVLSLEDVDRLAWAEILEAALAAVETEHV